jgi:hypothetical protein
MNFRREVGRALTKEQLVNRKTKQIAAVRMALSLNDSEADSVRPIAHLPTTL